MDKLKFLEDILASQSIQNAQKVFEKRDSIVTIHHFEGRTIKFKPKK
jgi:hypothetical protein